MKLLTKDIEEKLKEYPLGSQDGKLGNSKVIAKFFNPTGVGTWYIIEGKLLENGDAEMFGYCNLGDDELAEFGTVMLSELESIQLPMGMTIERDLYIPKEINLIRSGKQLDFFGVKKEDLPIFMKEAKRYVILFSALVDKQISNGNVDIIVKAEDSSRVNRIVKM